MPPIASDALVLRTYKLGETSKVVVLLTRARGLEEAMALSYFAELIDAFAQEGEAEDPVYRLALAVVEAVGKGSSVTAVARYLEAWLLRLHGLYPSLDRCAACERELPAGAMDYHGPAHGFVCAECGPSSGPGLTASTRNYLRRIFDL